MIRGVICDLDGTVYLSGRPLPGAAEAISTVRNAGIGLVFVSNNPTVSASDYAARLTAMDIPTQPDQVITSGGVTTEWLLDEHPDARVLLVSEASLRQELMAAGVRVVDDPTRTDVVVVSFDRTFDYAKWRAAFDAIRLGARFVATNADATCPVDGGEVPDCAGIIAALEATTGHAVDLVLGKPSPVTAATAVNRLTRQLGPDVAPEDVLVVGDRIQTDLRMGADAGHATALVLTGVSRREDLVDAEPQPTHVLAGLHELPSVVTSSGAALRSETGS